MKKPVLRCPSSSVLNAYFFSLPSLLSFALRAIHPKTMRATCAVVVFRLLPFICVYLCSSVVASPQPSNDVHFCLPLNLEDMQARDSIYAATKHALNLNVGEPRTVRMIYFLPNDRPFRQEVVDLMKVAIRQIQTFYAEQMQAQGYGNKTFRFETDARGEPLVHRVDGQHPDSHYLDNTSRTVLDEVEQVFDRDANIYLIVVDNSINAIGTGDGRRAGGTGGNRGKSGGHGLVSGGFSFHTAAHELGHGFGLRHDFRDGNYIMSYGPRAEDQLSACNAEFLAVHPYFNLDIPISGESESGFREIRERVTGGPFELMSSREYPAGSQSVSIQLKVSDSDGLHQVILLVKTRESHSASGSLEVKSCHGLAGETDIIVEFEYNGLIPSDNGTSLSNPAIHPIYVLAVDTDGNVRGAFFRLIEISSQLIAIIKTDRISSVAFSPDGTILASASSGSIVNLWDVATQTNIATLQGSWSVAFSPDGTILASGTKMWDVATREHIATLGEQHRSHAIAFSPDGTILASGLSGSDDNTIELWDVRTKQPIATLDGHSGWIFSVAFSPDGRILASGGAGDGAIKLWDVATRTNIAMLSDTRISISDIQSIAFSPDGTILASGSGSGRIEHSLNLWDITTKQPIATLSGRTSWGSLSVAFSPDGTMLASGEYDGAINLWNVATIEPIAILAGHTDAIHSVVFSPDGRTLVSGSEDTTIRLWDVSALGQSILSQDIFSLSLDGDGAADNQAVTSLDISPGSVISLQVFGKNIQDAEGVSLHFAYDETQVLYEGFEPGGVFPNAGMAAWVTSVPGTNPTTINIQSFGEKAIADSGLVGRVRFRTTSAFSGTTLWLVRADLGGPKGIETALDHISVTLQLATQDIFSLSLDGDSAAGDQAVTSLDVSPGSVVSLQVFGKDIQNADGIFARFEYDATQVLYEGFEPGSILPNAQVLALPSMNPTAIEVSLVSFGGQVVADSGLVGSIRFRTTSAFSGTKLRLVRAELGRGGQREEVTFDNTSVALQLAVLTPDFNGDGRVDLSDFLLFASQFGLNRGDEQYDAKYDLDGDGTIGFGDFLIFGRSFGKEGS